MTSPVVKKKKNILITCASSVNIPAGEYKQLGRQTTKAQLCCIIMHNCTIMPTVDCFLINGSSIHTNNKVTLVKSQKPDSPDPRLLPTTTRTPELRG